MQAPGLDGALLAYRQDRRKFIRKDLDDAYRRGLLESAAALGGQRARWCIRQALENGPSRGGFDEMMKFFGWTDLRNPQLLMTAPVIDGLEVTMPGFKKWLEFTGFGNDKTMVRGFIAWAEYVTAEPKVSTAGGAVFRSLKDG